MEFPIINVESFGFTIKSENNIKLDIMEFVRKFPIDIYLNETKTQLFKEIDGITTPVSPTMLELNKKTDNSSFTTPTGFVSIFYSIDNKAYSGTMSYAVGRTTFSNPPIGPIHIGLWCSSCDRIGPEFHKKNCQQPKSSLNYTLLGIIKDSPQHPITKKYGSTPLDELINVWKEDTAMKNKYEYTEADWPLLNIPYGKSPKNIFSNCAIIKYNFNDGKSISIRLYDNGTVVLVSCPWNQKFFYLKFIRTLQQLENIKYITDPIESKVSSVFSFFNFVGKGYNIKLDEIYKYLWPLDKKNNPTLSPDSPKRIFTKIYEDGREIDHNYLYYNNDYYRYTISYRTDLNTPKLTIILIPCKVDQIPLYCLPYKISLLVFITGKTQATFSYCKDESLCDEKEIILDTIEKQYKEIEDIITNAVLFVFYLLKEIQDRIVVKNPLYKKDKSINTVSGILPYTKAKLHEGQTVDVFDKNSMEWEKTGTLVESQGKESLVEVGEEDILVDNKDLRPQTQTSTTPLLRKNNKPEPYGFMGKCPDDNSFIPFGGKQVRDNLYYPYCEKKTKDKYNIYIDRIVHGFPKDKDDEIKFNIKRDQADKYSGVFKEGVTDVGNEITFNRDNQVLKGTIISKNKTRSKGLDNEMVYTVKDDLNNQYKITGKDFTLDQREQRQWEGVDSKLKLINCAQKLGLVQKNISNKKIKNKYHNKIKEHKTDKITFLSQKNKYRLDERRYMLATTPNGSKKVYMYLSNKLSFIMDQSNNYIDLKIKSSFDCVVWGYMDSRDFRAIDCLYVEKIKLGNYFSKNNKVETRFLEYIIEESGLNINKYKSFIDYSNCGRLVILYIVMAIVNSLLSNSLNISKINIIQPHEYIIPKFVTEDIMGRLRITRNPLETLKNKTRVSVTEKNQDIILIPRKGQSSILLWKDRITLTITLKNMGNTNSQNIKLGVDDKVIFQSIKVPSKLQTKYIRLILQTGKPPIFDSPGEKKDVYPYSKTKVIIDSVLSPVDKSFFDSLDL